jgi:hypothetical protein
MEKWTDEWMVDRMDGWKDGWDVLLIEWDGWRNEWVYEYVDGIMGWKNGLMN